MTCVERPPFPCSPQIVCRGKLRGGAIRLLIACPGDLGTRHALTRDHPRTRAIVVLIFGWGAISVGRARDPCSGRSGSVDRLDVPLLGAGVARVAALILALRKIGPPAARGRVLPVLDADLHRRLAIASGRPRSRACPETPGLGLLLLLRLDRLREPSRRHHRGPSKGARTATMIELLTGTAAPAAHLGLVPRLRHRGRDRRGRGRRSRPRRATRLARDFAGVVDGDVDLALDALERDRRARRRAPCSSARRPGRAGVETVRPMAGARSRNER